MEHDLKVIARIRSPFPEKFGIPRQSGRWKSCRERLSLNRNTGIRMLCGGWRNFLISGLSGNFQKIRGRAGRPPCVRPAWEEMCAEGFLRPALLFAPISGLSCVKIERIEWESGEGPVIWVSGADLMDGTPIFDLKPYLPYVDCKKDASGGFTEEREDTACR